MSRARLRRRYRAHLRYIERCIKLGAGLYAGAYQRLLDRIWEE